MLPKLGSFVKRSSKTNGSQSNTEQQAQRQEQAVSPRNPLSSSLSFKMDAMSSADFDKDLSEIAAQFKENVKLSDRSYRLKTYKQCFIGSEAVDYLVESGATGKFGI